jgi:uncharacterized protein (TIGR03083 family)
VDFLQAIRREGDLFYKTAEGADPSLGVPSCPDWSIADLVWHLGEVHWFWASDIEQRASRPEQLEAAKPARPPNYTDLVAWGRAQLERMLEVLERSPDDTAVWTWALDDRDHTVGFIRRHQVQEAAVHRWDMQAAATTADPDPVDPEVALDSVDEFLWSTLPWGVNHKRQLPGTVHLHCTDAAGEWLIERDGTVNRSHAKADVAVRATASELLLVLYNRVSVDDLEVVGEAPVLRELLRRVEGT